MKSAYIMGALLLLTACGGGGGGTPSNIVTPTNLSRTSMQDSANNKSNIIAYVADKISNTPSAANTSGTSTVQSRNSAIRTNSVPTYNFDNAIKEYQNMYDFATDNTDGKTDNDLKHAYLLSGGTITDWESMDKDAIKQFIKDHHVEAINKFFTWQDGKPVFKHKTSNLADMKLQQIGSRDWDEDYIRITQTKNGKIESIALKDGWFDAELNFERKSDDKYSVVLAKYRMPYKNSMGDVSWLTIDTDQDNLNEKQIKELFQNALNAPNAKETFFMTDEEIILAQNAANNLTTDDMISLSYTEWEKLEERQEVVYLTKSNMDVNIQAYGQETGLKFSDFGTISGVHKKGKINNDQQDIGYVFAGGYDIKEISKETINKKMEFAGNAVGKVMYFYEDETGAATQEYLNIAAAANMIFDNGKETLTANFSENKNAANRWYDVVVEFNGTDADLSLDNGHKISENNAKFKFDGIDTKGTFKNIIQGGEDYNNPNGIDYVNSGNFTSTYYSDGTTPSEAVGTVSFLQQEWKTNLDTNREEYNKEVNFMAGFGVVKK